MSRSRRIAGLVLPALVGAVWVGIAIALGVAGARLPGPRLLAVEGVESWRDAQAARLRCQFAQGWHFAEVDRAWTGCFSDDGVFEIARADLATGELLRRWPLPEVFRLPSPLGREAAPVSFVAIEGFVRKGPDSVVLVMSRWGKQSDDTTALLTLRDEGGVGEPRVLPADPLSLRGLVVHGGVVELVLNDGRLLQVGDEVVESRLPRVGEDDAVEWAERTTTGWRLLVSREVRPAVVDSLGERAVWLVEGEGKPASVGSLQTTVLWPYGEYVEMAAGRVANGYLPGAKRLVGQRLEPVPPPDGPVDPDEWSLVSGPVDFLVEGGAGGALVPVRHLIHPTTFSRQVLRVGEQWWWLTIEGDGEVVRLGRSEDAPAVARHWSPFVPYVVPASGGGVWLVDKVGRYAKLDADLARADPPGFVARVLAAVRGDQVQASGHSSEAADGIDDAFVWSATERRAALPWALLGAPAALAAFGALRRRWPRTARAACLVWLAGMAVLAEGLLSALEKL